jgi:hypothetical protein
MDDQAVQKKPHDRIAAGDIAFLVFRLQKGGYGSLSDLAARFPENQIMAAASSPRASRMLRNSSLLAMLVSAFEN